MAGPNDLNTPGQEVKFPTWGGSAETTIWIRNNDNFEAEVIIQAGTAGGETLKIGPNNQGKFVRQFWGVEVRIINSSGNRITVWTV